MKKRIFLFALLFTGYNGFAQESTVAFGPLHSGRHLVFFASGTIIHQVFFWLEHPDSMEDKAELKKGLTTQCDKKMYF